MSRDRLPPPQPEACLTMSRASRYKGGTIIAEDVWSPEEHELRMSRPDSYRPGVCGRCGNDRLHVHDYLERKPLGVAMAATLRIVRFICTNPSCGATWRVLPAFLARHLWWVWRRVEAATMSPSLAADPAPVPMTPPVALPPGPAGSAPAASQPGAECESAPIATAGSDSPPERTGRYRSVPERTRARWLGRLRSSARQLVVLLGTSGTAAIKAVAEAVHLDATRRELVEAYSATCGISPGTRFASLAALVDRLERGIRFV